MVPRPADGPVYDDFDGEIVAGYSFRRILTSYLGDPDRIRRGVDNGEQDVPFGSNNNIDAANAEVFCGAGDGFHVTAYDQKGSANLTAASAGEQPKLVVAGVFALNDASIFDDTANQLLFEASGLGFTSFPISLFAWFKTSSSPQFTFIATLSDTTDNNSFIGMRFGAVAGDMQYVARFAGSNQDVSGSSGADDGTFRSAGQVVTSSQNQGFLDGVSEGTNAHADSMWTATSAIMGGLRTSTSLPGEGEWDGTISEVVFFNADMSGDMATINGFDRPLI